MNNGYYETFVGDCHYYTHRLIAEKMLGRRLKNGEVVHHIDGDKTNNDPSNLMVFKTGRDHVLFHKGYPIQKEGDVWVAIDNEVRNKHGQALVLCPVCKINYMSDRRAKMCSKCWEVEKKINLKSRCPSKDVLLDLLLKYPVSSIGKMYGVTSKAVVKWLINNNLPHKHSDIKLLRLESSNCQLV